MADDDTDNPQHFENHESGLASQRLFQRQVHNLTDTMKAMGNPFLDDFPELAKLDNRDCVDNTVAEGIRSVKEIGQMQYEDYRTTVIIEQTKSLHEPIKKNNLPLFKKPQARLSSKQGKKISALKNNVNLFAKLYIAMQSRESDLAEFFSHEVQSFPPSLSEYGSLRLPTSKSDLLGCLPKSNEQCDPPCHFHCRILDGAVIVHCLPTIGICTFDDYADRVFIPHLVYQLENSDRVHVV